MRLSASILNGINRPTISFLLSLLRMVILYVPLAWITSVLFGLQGIFWSAFAANIMAGSVAWYWLHRMITNRTEAGITGEPVFAKNTMSR